MATDETSGSVAGGDGAISGPGHRVLILIPAFNEEASVGDVVGRTMALGFPALVIDDGSTDGTADCAEMAGATVLRLPVNLGVGGALKLGFRYAVEHGYGVVVQCDADGQHSPDEIAQLLAVMKAEDADMVIGSRFTAGSERYSVGASRRIVMRVLAAIASRAVGRPVTDSTSGFRAIRQPLLGAFAVSYPAEYLGDTVEALIEAGRGGYRVRETPVRMNVRVAGQSSASWLASVWYTVRVLVLVALRARRSTRSPRV